MELKSDIHLSSDVCRLTFLAGPTGFEEFSSVSLKIIELLILSLSSRKHLYTARQTRLIYNSQFLGNNSPYRK